MSILRRLRSLDDAVLGAPPSSPEERLSFLRRAYLRGPASGTAEGIVGATVLDLAERLAAAERRIDELEREGNDS